MSSTIKQNNHKPNTSKTSKSSKSSKSEKSSQILKNATSNIFFNSESTHKHRVDFKENESYKQTKSINTSKNQLNESNINSIDLKTLSLKYNNININKTIINLNEIKENFNNIFDFVSFCYSKKLTSLIPPKQFISTKQKMSIRQNTSISLYKLKNKEKSNNYFLNLIKKRLDLILNHNLSSLDMYFPKEFSKDVLIFLNLEVKVLLSIWIIIEINEGEDEEKVVDEFKDLIIEIFQDYIYIYGFILGNVKEDYKNNDEFRVLVNLINERSIFSDQTIETSVNFIENSSISLRLKSIIMILSNMTRILIMKNIKKDPAEYIKGNDEKSILKRMNFINNKTIFDMYLYDILRYIHIVNDEFVRNMYNKLRNDYSLYSMKNSDVFIKPRVPYLKPMDKEKYKYTLVLDLDETLIHYSIEGNNDVLIRNGAVAFLEELSFYYEIVIFTAAVQSVSLDYSLILIYNLIYVILSLSFTLVRR